MPDDLKPYIYLEQGGKAGFVLAAAADVLRPLLFGAGEIAMEESAGRGRILRFSLGDDQGVLRPYRRGGLMARLFGDRYVENRMRREFELTARLYASGASVPQPLGVAWERRGIFYRGALATRALNGITLLDYLRGGTIDDAVLRLCGRRIREIHDRGVWHADLQAMNLLVGDGEVWLIDFDNARDGRAVSDLGRARNLLRLRRSLEKHGQCEDNFKSILAGYGELGLPRWLSRLYWLRGMGRTPNRNKTLP